MGPRDDANLRLPILHDCRHYSVQRHRGDGARRHRRGDRGQDDRRARRARSSITRRSRSSTAASPRSGRQGAAVPAGCAPHRSAGHDPAAGIDRHAHAPHRRSALQRLPGTRIHGQFLDRRRRRQRQEDSRGGLHHHPQRRVRPISTMWPSSRASSRAFVPGPRIVPATYAIGATGGHCDSTEFPPSISVPSPQIANGPEEIRATVRKLRKYGAEVIKFCGTGGVLSKTDTVGAPAVRPRGNEGPGRRGPHARPQGRGACARRIGNQGRHPRRRRHHRTRQPRRRRSLRAGQAARHLVLDGHLQR